MNLRHRITLPIVTLIVVVVTGVGLVCYTLSRRALEAQLAREMSVACETTVATVEQWVEARRVDLRDRAGDADAIAALGEGAAAQTARERITQDYARGMATIGGIEMINLVDAHGDVIASSRPETVRTLNVQDRAYFRDALAGSSAISEVLESRLSGQPVISLAVPVKDGAEVRGVLSVVLDLTAFSTSVVGRVKVLESGYAYLYAANGVVVAHPDKTRILKAKISDSDWGRQIFERRDGAIAYDFDGARRFATFRTSKKLNWGVVAVAKEDELLAPVRRLAWTVFGLGVIAAAAGATMTYFIARAIERPLLRVAQQLAAGADRTATAATQLATGSQQLAEGASEQAAALEETSSSLEELASMTKHNAEGSRQAKELAHTAKAVAESGATDMAEMERAMAAIKKSGDDVARIIRTIDEIAFQTNILALNAAVEAARAGEAGAGFAVVADEVRTLAQRSAQAAKETATLIDQAIANMGHGVGISTRVGASLHKIVAQVRQFDEMAGQVATASTEQSQGIGQVNTAITQMDKVTQSNAASAEESASAAEELNTQAAVLTQIARDLRTLVAGAASAASEVPDGTGTTLASRAAVVAPRLMRGPSPDHDRCAPSVARNGGDHFTSPSGKGDAGELAPALDRSPR